MGFGSLVLTISQRLACYPERTLSCFHTRFFSSVCFLLVISSGGLASPYASLLVAYPAGATILREKISDEHFSLFFPQVFHQVKTINAQRPSASVVIISFLVHALFSFVGALAPVVPHTYTPTQFAHLRGFSNGVIALQLYFWARSVEEVYQHLVVVEKQANQHKSQFVSNMSHGKRKLGNSREKTVYSEKF